MSKFIETRPDCIVSSELYLPAEDLKTEMPFFIEALGFQLDEIFPADDPAVAVLSGHGVRIRVDRNANISKGLLRLRCREPDDFAEGAKTLTSPSGNTVEITDAYPILEQPTPQHSFMVRQLRDNDSWVIGRWVDL